MDASKQGTTKEYQQMIISDKHSKHWTQFELDLIGCIRDEYPIIFTKTGDWTRHQRAAKIRGAWKEISQKFADLPLLNIKSRWNSLVEQYSNLRKNASTVVPENQKFLDGTFCFLDKELNLLNKQEKNNKVRKNVNLKAGPSKEASTGNKNIGAESENLSSMYVAYNDSIRQLIHEEIDIDDDDETEIKKEADGDTSDDDGKSTTALQDMSQTTEEHEYNKEDQESEKKWDEEELMNATHLTKEMIQELILIKTRQYYNAPVSVNK